MKITYQFPVVHFFGDDPEDSELTTYGAEIDPIKLDKAPYEAYVSALDSKYHIIFGKHHAGGFLCIPDYHVGCEISSLDDVFWNHESILHNEEQLTYEESTAIAYALKTLSNYVE